MMDDGKIDATAMAKLAKALNFILGADHPTTLALRKAAETGADADIKAARKLFLRLKHSERRAALNLLEE